MANLYIIISAFVSAVILGRIIIPNILIISLRKRLFDVPDERKVHKRPIPRLGGVTFFPVILFSLCVFTAVRLMTGHGPAETSTTDLVCEFLFLTGGLTLLYIVGIADDLIGVRYRKKFLVQIISAAMFPLSGLYINNFYGLFGIYLIPAEVGIPLTMLLVVFITNAINLIDGIDGLASGLSMVALLLFGLFILIEGIRKAGVIDAAAQLFYTLSGDDPFRLYTLLVFVSVGLSAFIDNIPYVATMLPVVQGIAGLMNGGAGFPPELFYFGLLTGATLGGNLTPIGASANIAAIGILRKQGEQVRTRDFLRIGIPFTLAAVLTGYVYLWLVWGA